MIRILWQQWQKPWGLQQESNGKPLGQKARWYKRKWGWNRLSSCWGRNSWVAAEGFNTPSSSPGLAVGSFQIRNGMFPSVYTWEQKSITKKCLRSPGAYSAQMNRLQKTRSTWNRCQQFQRWEEVIIMKLSKAVSRMWIMHVGGLWVLILSSVRISSTALFQKF